MARHRIMKEGSARLGERGEERLEGLILGSTRGEEVYRTPSPGVTVDRANAGIPQTRAGSTRSLDPAAMSIYLPPLPPTPVYDLNSAPDQVKEGALTGGAKV